MKFELRAEKGVSEELRRIFREQLSEAGAYVANDARLTDKDIHNARKAIKRARATLRLLRPALAESIFKETNLALRDAAHPLTQVRDAKVLLDAIAGLRKHDDGRLDDTSTATLDQHLQSKRKRARRALSVRAPVMFALRKALRTQRLSASRWRLSADDWSLLGAALRRIYKKARAAHAMAGKGRGDEQLHEWRKQAKHLWYAMQVLTPASPGFIGELADELHKLADYLGDDHDLALLGERNLVVQDAAPARDTVTTCIDKRREELQGRALALGERLFVQKPKRFVEQIERRWTEWHQANPSATARATPARREIAAR
ncbi:MAG TPA: CHAD domain-containing protein [Povalibacter sp.]